MRLCISYRWPSVLREFVHFLQAVALQDKNTSTSFECAQRLVRILYAVEEVSWLNGDFPLNHNKQKCKMFPNGNHGTASWPGLGIKSCPAFEGVQLAVSFHDVVPHTSAGCEQKPAQRNPEMPPRKDSEFASSCFWKFPWFQPKKKAPKGGYFWRPLSFPQKGVRHFRMSAVFVSSCSG